MPLGSFQMISARSYFERIVKPTIDQFRNDNGDLRLALLASMAVLHTVDYVMQNREPDPEKANEAVILYTRSSDREFAFEVVRDFALASKHCRLRDGSLHSGRTMMAYPSFTGVMRAGQSFLGDKIGGLTIQWREREYVNLTTALERVLQILEADFPELSP